MFWRAPMGRQKGAYVRTFYNEKPTRIGETL